VHNGSTPTTDPVGDIDFNTVEVFTPPLPATVTLTPTNTPVTNTPTTVPTITPTVSVSPTFGPSQVDVVVTSANGVACGTLNAAVLVCVPTTSIPGAKPGDTITIIFTPAASGAVPIPGQLLTFSLTVELNGVPVPVFSGPILVSITYDPSLVPGHARAASSGLQRNSRFEDDLHIVETDPTTGVSTVLSTSVDVNTHIATAPVKQPSFVSLITAAFVQAVPIVLDYNSAPTGGW
jgi:hypothetical protein